MKKKGPIHGQWVRCTHANLPFSFVNKKRKALTEEMVVNGRDQSGVYIGDEKKLT